MNKAKEKILEEFKELDMDLFRCATSPVNMVMLQAWLANQLDSYGAYIQERTLVGKIKDFKQITIETDVPKDMLNAYLLSVLPEEKELSPYIRNQGLAPHSQTTITNCTRRGFNACLAEIKENAGL